MNKYLVENTSLTAVADAIREKANIKDIFTFPDSFVEAINGIEVPAPRGKFLASGTITPADNILGTYTIETGVVIPKGHYAWGIVALDEPMERNNIENLYNSIIFTVKGRCVDASIYRDFQFTYGLGNTGNETTAAGSTTYGCISGVGGNTTSVGIPVGITLKGLQYGNNYTICLKAGHTYRWSVYEVET